MNTQTNNQSNTKIIIAGAVGNALEWYDFAIYGYFASQIGKVFFPTENPINQLLASFSIFAVGYLMRPLGGICFGYIGDRYGRQIALTISVIAMAVPTFLVGVIPGYDEIGLVAPIILTFVRMIQGLSVGGEFTTSMVFLVENAPPNRKAYMGSFSSIGCIVGILMGSASGALMAEILSTEQLNDWGWRIPFLSGLIIGLAGLFIRRHLPNSKPTSGESEIPLKTIFQKYRPLMYRLCALAMLNAIPFYLTFVYSVTWLEKSDQLSPSKALNIVTMSLVVLILTLMIVGRLGDQIGIKKILQGSAACFFIAALPLQWLLLHPEMTYVLVGQFCLSILVGLWLAVVPAFMVENVPQPIRCSAISLGYNLTVGVVGGLTPLFATWLVNRTDNPLSPAFLTMVAASVSFAALLFFKSDKNLG
jgi:MHS family proline/betaine transporter-like MFS transporter